MRWCTVHSHTETSVVTLETIAHCLGGDFKAVIGRDDIYQSNTGDVVQTKRGVAHPDYDSKTTEFDMALVFLQRGTTARVKLAQPNSRASLPSTGQFVTVMGWGDIIASDDMMELSENLQAVEVKTISNAQCEASSGRVNGQWDSYQNQIYDAMLCAADDNQDAVSFFLIISH
jgi:trypsin